MMQTRNNWLIGLLVVVVIIGCALSAFLAGAVVGGLVGGAVGYSAGEKASVAQEPPPELPPAWEEPWPELPRRTPPALERHPAALVITVEPEGPADEAGIRPGDFILAVDDQKISQDRDLAAIVRDYQPGDRVRLTLWRDGREKHVRVRLGRHRDEGGEVVARLGLTYRFLPLVPLPSR